MFKSNIPGLTGKRVFIFILCFIQYLFVHCCRSTWSYVSGRMVTQDYFTKEYLGYINFSFLFFYGSAISILGQFGDRMSLKVFVLCGTFSAALMVALIGVMIQYQVKHNYVYLILQIFNGIAQSTGWPAIINNWFMTDKKVILMGIYAACPNVGNIVGDFYAGSLVGHDDLPLETPMYLASVSLFTISLINIFFLVNGPDQPLKELIKQEYEQTKRIGEQEKNKELVISLVQNEEFNNQNNKIINNNQQDSNLANAQISQQEKSNLSLSKQSTIELKQLTYFQAWFVPNVAVYAFAFGCVKAVYYILGFWLPTYLDEKNVGDVAWITAMTDVGSIPGGIIICLIGYYFDKRAIVIVPSLWIGTIVLISINFTGDISHQIAGYMCLVFLTGLFIGGCYNNISSAMTVELSNQPELKKNKSATATVVSVIMGYAAMFAAVNQLVVPYVVGRLFLYCGFLSVLGGMFLIQLMVQEIQRIRKQLKIQQPSQL